MQHKIVPHAIVKYFFELWKPYSMQARDSNITIPPSSM